MQQIKVHWTQSIRLCSIGLGIQTQLNPIQWIAFDCFWGVNSLEQRLCGLKNKKNEMYWSNSNLKKLAIDFPPHFYKKQEFRNQNFDLVRLSNYFYTSSIWFDGQTQPIDWVWLKYCSIGFNWLCWENGRFQMFFIRATPPSCMDCLVVSTFTFMSVEFKILLPPLKTFSNRTYARV